MPPLHLELMPLEEKPPEAPPVKTIVVRYGFLREIGEFPSDITQKVGCGTKLILRTDRGIEIGEMLTTTCGNGGCNKSITRDKLLDYIDKSGGRNYPFSEQGRILRVATAQDLAEQAKLDENHHKHLNLARELVVTHKLTMKIVDVEHILGGERVLFYFVSEHRIDFRGLVRDLAHALHTRIELRQVGARDEARLTADYEKCGQHCCCKQFLKVLTPISMRAAKVQKATLDPTKISGRCGRLMCCLRYEDETYEELRKKLPKRNTRVKTEKGEAWVIDGQILTQLVLIQMDDGTREAVPMEKILAFDQPKPKMADGRTMQTPNDRPPPSFFAAGGPGASGADVRRPGGVAPAARQERPRPGSPAEGPEGDPRALTGPTGGDLNTEVGADALDDLMADAIDDASSKPVHNSEMPASQDGAMNMPPPAAPGGETRPPMPPMPLRPQGGPPRQGGGPRPPQGPRGGAPGGPRPLQGPRGGGPQQGGPRGPFQPPQGRLPQQGGPGGGFRPPQPRGPMPPNQQGQRPMPPGGQQQPPPVPPAPGAQQSNSPPPLPLPPQESAPPSPPAADQPPTA